MLQWQGGSSTGLLLGGQKVRKEVRNKYAKDGWVRMWSTGIGPSGWGKPMPSEVTVWVKTDTNPRSVSHVAVGSWLDVLHTCFLFNHPVITLWHSSDFVGLGAMVMLILLVQDPHIGPLVLESRKACSWAVRWGVESVSLHNLYVQGILFGAWTQM